MPTPYLSRLKLEKELEKKAKTLREKKEKCENLMSRIERYFSLIEDKVDLSQYKERYKKGKELYELKDMDSAIEVLESLHQDVGKEIKEVYAKEREKIERLLDLLSGEDVAKIKADLKEGEDKLDEDPERSFEILKEINEKINYVIEENINHVVRELKEVIGSIEGMEWVSEEVDKVKERNADALLQLKEIKDRAINQLKEMANGYVERTQKMIEIAASAHFSLPVDKSVEGKIKELMESGNYTAAIRAAREYELEAKKRFDFFFKKLYDIARRIVEEGKTMEIDMSSPEETLREAQERYEKEDFEGAVEAIKKATEEAEKLKFQRVMDVIKVAREKLLEAKEQGIDINPFLKRFDNARNFLKIGKHKRAYDVVLETMDLLERKRNLYQQLKEEVKKIKKEIGDLEKENIILEGVDETVKRIEEEIERDTEKAEKMLNDLRKGIKISLRDIAQTLYSEIEKMIEAAEREKIVLEDLKLSLNDAKMQITDENYKDAIIALRKIEEDIHTRVSDAINELEEKTSKYEDERIAAAIKDARDKLAEGDVLAALEDVSKIREITFEIEGKEYAKRIEKMKEEAEFLRKAGGNVTEVMSYIERAEIALKKKDIVRAEDFISRGEEALRSLENLVSKDVFDSAKIIAAASKRIGVNISKHGIMNLLKKAKDSIEKGDYKNAIKYSMEARDLAKDLRDRAEKAYSQLVSAAKKVAHLKEMGADVSEIAQYLVDAKKKFEENEFEEAEKLSEECIRKAEAIENKARIEYVRKELDSLGKVMMELGLGNEFKRKSLEFYNRYEEMKYEGLAELGESILSELREHVETILTDYIGKIETDIYDAREKGYDLNINLEDLENAKDLFIKRKYQDALYILKKLESQIATMYERNEKMTEIRNRIKKYIDMAISLGIDVKPYKEALNSLEQYKNMKRAQAEANKIIKDIEAALYKKVRSVIMNVEKELDKMRRRGEDVTAPENILNKAKALLKEKKYVEALNRAMAAVGEIEKYEIQKNTAYGILKRLEVKIKAMQKILPKDILNEYDYAKKLFLKGLYEQSIERSMRVSERISELERIINYIKEKNQQIREMVMKAHRLGMDVKDVLKLFNQAKEEFKKMNYQESLRLVDQCYTEAKLLMIDAVNKYKSSYSKMATIIKRLGLEEHFKDDMREMDRLFEEGDYDGIKVKLSEMKKELNKKLGELSEKIMKDFQKKKRMFKALNVDIGIDLEKADMKLRELKAKDYTKFFEYASMLDQKMEGHMPLLIEKKVSELKAEFDKYERYGINMDEYHSKLYDILSMMEERDYEEIFSMLEELEENFHRYLDEYIKSMVEKVRKRVGEYSEEKANEYVERMERMRKVGNYGEAIKIYREANDYITRYKVFMEEFGKKVEEVKDRLRFALSLGLKVGDLISKLKEIEERAPVDMERAKLDLEDLKSKLNTMIESLEPKIDVNLEVGEESDGRYPVKLIVENKGNADAQNMRIVIRGALVSQGPIELLKLEKGAREEIDAFLDRGKGNRVSMLVIYHRFDGKEYSETKEMEIRIEERKEEKKEESKGYRIEKAKEKVKCSLCRGTILPAMNLDVVICENCGAVYHVPCAKRIKKCKVCGQEFKFD